MKSVLQTFVVLTSCRKSILSNFVHSSLHSSHTSASCSSSSSQAGSCYRMVHTKCRKDFYHHRTDDGSFGQIARFPVADDKVPWTVLLPSYNPVEFTAPFVLKAVWADPELGSDGFKPIWNSLDGKVNRVSHDGKYNVGTDNRPVNMMGRTGVVGRGVLGRWGPNHAADPIVTRWKRGNDGTEVKDDASGKNILEFVSIQRRDNGEWAIPGGMVDPGEKVSTTVKREFMEEALDSTGSARENLEELKQMVEKFFAGGEEVYKGYVDDPRNTDNAWMETVAFSFHDSTGSSVGKFPLHAGDDAASICWMELNKNVKLYASHKDMLEMVVEKLNAHW